MRRAQRRARMRKPSAHRVAARHVLALRLTAQIKRAMRKIILNSTYGKGDAFKWNAMHDKVTRILHVSAGPWSITP